MLLMLMLFLFNVCFWSYKSTSHMVSNREDVKYPDAKAITIDDDHKKVSHVVDLSILFQIVLCN